MKPGGCLKEGRRSLVNRLASRSPDIHRSSSMPRFRFPLVLLLVCSAILVLSLPGASARQDPRDGWHVTKREMSDLQRMQPDREIWLRQHMDRWGVVRTDLWRKGIADFQRMAVAGGLRG